MTTTSILWDRTDWDSTAIDMDSDEEIGLVWWDKEWKAEAREIMLNETFKSMRAAEIAVELALEQEDILNG